MTLQDSAVRDLGDGVPGGQGRARPGPVCSAHEQALEAERLLGHPLGRVGLRDVPGAGTDPRDPEGGKE
ncbi:MAG: hypothetical protein ABII00_15990 [Elusimicrobiota bacterium]